MLTIDFETRSALDLKKVGTWRYAEDPTTEILCLSVKVDDQPSTIWTPGDPTEELSRLIEEADVIEAHNSGFEEAIWAHKMPIPLPIEKLRCSAAAAARLALPRKLETLCDVLETPIRKDTGEAKIMRKLAKKKGKSSPKLFSEAYSSDLEKLYEYCRTDTDCEHEASKAMPAFPPKELDIWKLDQSANRRGVTLDLELIDKLMVIAEDHMAQLTDEFVGLMGYKPTCTVRFAKDLDLPSADKKTLTKHLPKLSGKARRAVEIRLLIGKASVKKLAAARAKVSTDGRLRDILVYRGAATSRWTGKGMQLQNLPSRGLIEDPDTFVDAVLSGADLHTLEMFYPDIMLAISSVIRLCLVASDGMDLYAADFSAIEGRVMAWLVGEEQVLEDYRNGIDLYKREAMWIYGVEYDQVTKAQRQVGKVPVLAGGYGGGWRAYMQFATDMGIAPPVMSDIAEDGLTFEETSYRNWFSPMVLKWREAHPATASYWQTIEEAFREALKSPNKWVSAGRVRLAYNNTRMAVELPSGNRIYFHNPRTRKGGRLVYDTLDQGRWCTRDTYGGKLAGSVVQGIARDMMAAAMLRIKERLPSLHLLFTVHDEIVSEGSGVSIEEYNALMAEAPDWAEGCPVDVEGWKGKRYRK